MGDYYKTQFPYYLRRRMATEKKGASKQKILSKRTGRKLRYVNDATFKHRPPLLLLCAKSESKQYRQYKVCNNIFNISNSLIYFRYD